MSSNLAAENNQNNLAGKEEAGENNFSVLEGFQKVINEKLKRCEDFKKGQDRDRVYPTLFYKENSPKEEVVLEHVIQFKKQFMYHMQNEDIRDLFLYPKNECGVYKFICTTIRPTKLGFLELYDFNTCAKFVSQFIQYEQLDPPNEFPKVIPSPTNVARWQKGDCFDISILLTSLLIGVGYDAYCIYGKAPREITTKNESLLECLYKNKGKLEEDDESKKVTKKIQNQFTIKKKDQIYSKWDTKIQQQLSAEEAEKRRKAETIDDDQPDELPEDQYGGQRIHCWVLLKRGKRGVERNIFIEPSTGRFYYPDGQDCLYESVDAIFNNHNFWINMHPELPIKDINFDEIDTSDLNWEYVMLDTMQFNNLNQDDEGNEGDELLANKKEINQEQQELQDLVQVLDMPPPWPPKIYIDKEQFMKSSPLGEETQFFNKVKVDNYTPYGQPDGLVQKITIYQDYKKLKIQEVRYFYQHRSDKLVIRRKFPFEFKTVEDYEKTKYDEKFQMQWKRLTKIDRHKIVYEYYPNRNHDGLIKRTKLIGEKTIEEYEGRDDRVIYRSIRFDLSRKDRSLTARDYSFQDNHYPKEQAIVTKMTQKYERNPQLSANSQIAKIVIDLSPKQQVKVYYHMEHDEIKPIIKIFDRHQMLGIAKQNETSLSDKNFNEQVSQHEIQRIHNMEKECMQAIRHQETKAKDDYRQVKETPLYLEKTLEQRAREKFKRSQEKTDDDKDNQNQEPDYLYPYLVKLNINQPPGSLEPLSFNDALAVKNEVMKKLKDRLLSRAEIIQKRLEEERAEQAKLEAQMNKKKEVDKLNDEQMQQITFKIQILESRAFRFETTAIEKYQKMDEKLNKDPRLVNLHKNQRNN